MTDDEQRSTREVAPANDAPLAYEMSDGESVTEAVTTALISLSRRGERELRPLYGTVDPDALDSLFARKGDGTPREADGHVAFDHGPYRVRVESDGFVAVERTERARSGDDGTLDDGTFDDGTLDSDRRIGRGN